MRSSNGSTERWMITGGGKTIGVSSTADGGPERGPPALTVVASSPRIEVLRRIHRQQRAIVRQVLQTQGHEAPVQAFADLAPYPAKAGPAQSELRQGPLQEVYAVGVFHGPVNTGGFL